MIKTSSRDPDGYIIKYKERLFRIILSDWEIELNLLNDKLFDDFSIPIHNEISEDVHAEISCYLSENGYNTNRILKILEVQIIDPITYPWEWTPSMLVKAGIFTIRTQLTLMDSDLSLKDASFLNLQFVNEQINFLDLLSIKKIESFYPWIPYGQFLRHFIYPSSLHKYGKIDNLKLLWSYPDGIDFEYVNRLLPLGSWFNLFEFFHFKIASMIKSEIWQNEQTSQMDTSNSKQKLRNLLEWNLRYLERIDKKLPKRKSFWKNYYERDVTNEYVSVKREKLKELFKSIDTTGRVLDIGSNTGEYSELLLEYFNKLICIEKDTVCCETLFWLLSEKYPKESGKNWKVINSNITNPDPGLGWMNTERDQLLDRIKSDSVTALGLIHHLYFTDSIDFIKQADLFSKLSMNYLVVEFITSDDDKVKIVSRTNPVRLKYYNRENFLDAFLNKFELSRNIAVNNTREIFLFKKNREIIEDK